MSTSTSELSQFNLKLLRCAAGTDVGMHREENQDSFGVIKGEGFHAYLVADGMGGTRGGAMASRMAIAGMRDGLKQAGFRVSQSEVVKLIRNINKDIFDKGSQDPALAGMGTTLVGLFFTQREILEINVGDSRAYRIRNGAIAQISEDHTLVRELVRSGALQAEEAAHHPVSHLLTRSLGPIPEVQAECRVLPDMPREGDIYVLCSDGLYNLVPESDILAVVRQNHLDDANQILINLANRRGGLDNITVLLIAVGGRPSRERATTADLPQSDILEGESLGDGNSTQNAPPMVEEPTDARVIRDALRARRELLRRRSRYGPLPLIVGFALLLGVVVGEVARRIFPERETSPFVLRPHRSAKDPSAASVAPEIPRLPRQPEELLQLPAAGENPLAEVAKQVELGLRTRNGAEFPVERSRGEIERSLAKLSAQIEQVSKSSEAPDQARLKEARERISSLQSEIEALDRNIDAASRAVILWLGRQVQFGASSAFDSPSELETVGAYSETVKATLEAIAKLSYQYREAADDVELHPGDERYRTAFESVSAKRDQLKQRLQEEVRGTVSSYLTKSYSEYQALKSKRESLAQRLKEANLDAEVLSALLEPDLAKRQIVLEKLRGLQKAEQRELADR